MKPALLFLLMISTLCNAQRADFIDITFEKADSIALAHKGESLRNLPLLIHNLTANLSTDVEKFRAIYTWVGTNIENDYSAYLRTRKKRKKLSQDQEALIKWNNSFTPKVFENLLKHKKTACTGYAYLIRELAILAGLNCKIIDGYGRTATLILDKKSIPNHSWNAIELNGKWYLCDSTWSAGRIVLDEGKPRFESDYHDGYFLADPTLFVKNHYPLDLDWSLVPQPPTFDEFIDGPVVYKEAFPRNIIPNKPGSMKFEAIKNEPVQFVFEVPKGFKSESMSIAVNSGTANKAVESKVTMNHNKCLLEYSFKALGIHDVHIQFEGDIITTYVVKVKRR